MKSLVELEIFKNDLERKCSNKKIKEILELLVKVIDFKKLELGAQDFSFEEKVLLGKDSLLFREVEDYIDQSILELSQDAK